MFIYQLPFTVNKELCRLLDNDDNWKELAGIYMKFSPFDINEMEQTAKRQATSPTNQLLIKWGQLNHRVDELFILLYRMQHRAAMHCIRDLVVEKKYLKLLMRGAPDINGNRQSTPPIRTQTTQSEFIPVMLLDENSPTRSQNAVVVTSNPSTTDESSTVGNTSSTQDIDPRVSEELRHHVSAIPFIKYEELKEATGGWSKANLLGQGGFGQVFKGEWKLSGVAVKRLANNDGKNRELIGELCLNQYRHDNILPLYGYSLGGPEACLVYQLMAGGSLEQRLRCKTQHPPLSWPQRHGIAHGVARGLQFLHTMSGTPLIHGDIKPANILLDTCSVPKIGDFGLARKGPYGDDRSHMKVSRVHGTRAYLPEEYLRSRCLSPAVDVFSFGVVLVEAATGLRAVLPPAGGRKEPVLLSDYIHQLAAEKVDFSTLEDRMISGTTLSHGGLCREFVALGLRCTAAKRQERPSMLAVFRALDALTKTNGNHH